MEWALDVIWSLPNEGPNSTRFSHNDMVDLSTGEIFVCSTCHFEVLSEEHSLQSGMCNMAKLNHLEAEVLPSNVLNGVNKRAQKCKSDHLNRTLKRLWLLFLNPSNHRGHKEWRYVLLELHQDTDHHEFHQFSFVCFQHAFHEGKSILWVFFDVVLDVFLKHFLFFLNLKSLRKLAVLFEFDLLTHTALKKRPWVPVKQFVPERCVLSHVCSLEDLVHRFLLGITITFFFACCHCVSFILL